MILKNMTRNCTVFHLRREKTRLAINHVSARRKRKTVQFQVILL